MITARIQVARGKATEVLVVACAMETCDQSIYASLADNRARQSRVQSKWLAENGWGKYQGKHYCRAHRERLQSLTEAEEAIMRSLDAQLREAKR